MMTIRGIVFWAKDRMLSKGQCRSAYKDVQRGFTEGIENFEQRNLIVNWARKNVPFYAKYKDAAFEELPVVNKRMIREGGDAFMAVCMKNVKLHTETTSGSTGAPFTIFQDCGGGSKRLRAQADSLVLSDRAGFHLGTRLYYVRVWNELNRKSKLQSFAQNIVMQESDKLSDQALEKWLIQMEHDKQEKSVLGYASSITALYQWMIRTGRKTTAKVSCFITMSESLPDYVKEGMKSLFGCPVISRYSNQECGLISQQCASSNEYHINTRSFYVEILDMDKDVPVPDGVKGRIVVTDLYNRAMPLIRYDTGDIGVMSHKSECGMPGKVLKTVEGRKVDFIYATNGDMLSPVSIINLMWLYADLLQYQFIQYTETDYEIKLNSSSVPYEREAPLLDDLHRVVGHDAQIKVSYVDEIPLLSSGKRKQVVNKFKK